MANYATLKAAIDAAIKTNGEQAITGQVLNTILNSIVTTLGGGYRYMGVAGASDNPGTPDNNVFYLATAAGTYTNFGGAVLDGSVLCVLSYNGSWTKTELSVPTSAALSAALADYTTTEGLDATYAKKDGSYDALTAGRAKNIDGKNSLEGTFLFRTTAGDADVASGVATVEKVKGNAVPWNQLSEVVDFTNSQYDTRAALQLYCVWRDADSVVGAVVLDSSLGYHSALLTAPATAVSVIFKHNGQIQDFTIFTEDIVGGHKFVLSYNVIKADPTIVNGVEIDGIQLHDLTPIFGAGNEPSSVALFEAWLAANVGDKPYFPATQKLLPTKLLGLKTRGFNQWDEEWENAYFDGSTGEKIENANCLCSENLIPVLPNTTYFAQFPLSITRGIYISKFDASGNYLGNLAVAVPGTFTTGDAAFIGFNTLAADAVRTYNNDICINLSWDGSRNGEYEPAEIREYNLDVTKFYGKLNGEGDYVQIFPNGMRKADYAGTVRDLLDLVNAEADVKVGKYTITGQETWAAFGGAYYAAVLSSAPCVDSSLTKNAISAKLAGASSGDLYASRVESGIAANQSNIYISSSDYANVAALAGLEIYYALATPLHYTDLVYRDNGVDTPVEALNILVNNWGTEEEIVAAPEASGEPNSCAATLDILYGIDAAEQLDTINQSGIFTDSLKANLEALIGVLNTNCSEALGGTIAISDNPTDKVYTFTFTPNEE